MKKNAVIFLDFNETFDDIYENKGRILFWSLSHFINHFKGQVDIVIITSAPYGVENFSIRSDLKIIVSRFSKDLQRRFKYLIENNNTHLTELEVGEDTIEFRKTEILSDVVGTKKDGVEEFLKDRFYHTCVFAGNNENLDLVMMDAQIKTQEKYFLLANGRKLKSSKYPIYRLSMQKTAEIFNYGKKIMAEISPQDELIIKTGTKSYGLGRGFEALTSYLEEKDNSH